MTTYDLRPYLDVFARLIARHDALQYEYVVRLLGGLDPAEY